MPATFRPQGLAALSTVCALAGLVGFISRRQRLWGSTLRSFLLIRGWEAFLPCFAPHVVTPDSHSSIEDRRGLIRSPTTGFFRGTIPCAPGRSEPAAAPDAPLGFSPFQGLPEAALADVSTRLLSRAYLQEGCPACFIAPQSLNQRLPGPIPNKSGTEQPSEGFAPQHSWHSSPRSLRAMCSPRKLPRVTAGRHSL
jgi:hypothetical protein